MRGRGAPVAVIAAIALCGTVVAAVAAHADETTIGYNLARTAWDQNETRLDPASVQAADFGKLFDQPLFRPAGQTTTSFPNQVYAQPLVADGAVIVATEENEVDAVDPVSGAIKWHVSLGPAFASPTGCGDLVPHIGVTSTPVYDPATNTVYLGAKTDNGTGGAQFRLHALDADNGQERTGWPVEIVNNQMPTNSNLGFNPTTANQRPALLLMGGSVYVAFASHCDKGPYVGYVGGINTTTRSVTLWSAESKLANDKAGIWMSGGGPVSDGPGRIFVATGNGVSPPVPSSKTSMPSTLAESVVRLDVQSGGTLKADDFFSPANNANLDANDFDLGSGAPVALPDAYGTTLVPHLLVQVGKDGRVFLLNRDNLGGAGQGANNTDNVVSSVQLANGLWGKPAIFSSGSSHYIYIVQSTNHMVALQVSPNGSNVPTLSVAGNTSTSFPYTSSSPAVTSDGTDPATAVVWVVRSGGGSNGTNAQLLAFRAVPPSSGSWDPIYTSAVGSIGTIAKFISPATDNGRVYLGTRDGRILAFGRPVQAALVAPGTEFGTQGVNTTSSPQTVTVTVQSPITVNSMSTSGPFAAGSPSIALPHTFAAPGSFTVPVTFTPTVAGSADGSLSFLAGQLNDEYDFSLHGSGTLDGLVATPSPLAFGAVSTSSGKQLGVTITNTGTTSTTILSSTLPGAPYTVSGLPAVGSTIGAQQSVAVTVLFQPSSEGELDRTLTIQSSTGSVSVPLTGSGYAGSPHMQYDVSALNFGSVQPGQTKTSSFVISNTGDGPLTITKAAVPSPPFKVATPVQEGQTLQPGDTLTVSVTFAPTTARPASDGYAITANDGQGAQTLMLSANSAAWQGPVRSPQGCLQLRYGVVANSTLIEGYTCNGSVYQMFSMGTNASLHFGAATSTWCVDVRSSGTATGTPVQLYRCNATAAQRWVWRDDNTLWNPNSGKCLDMPRTAKGTSLRIATCTKGDSQYWDLSAQQAARGLVSSALVAANQLCMHDRAAATTDGNPIETYACDLSAAEMVVRVNQTLRLFGKCVTVSGTANGSPIFLSRCTAASNQTWTFRSNGTLYNPTRDKCMVVTGATTAQRVQLTISTCTSYRYQLWRLP